MLVASVFWYQLIPTASYACGGRRIEWLALVPTALGKRGRWQ